MKSIASRLLSLIVGGAWAITGVAAPGDLDPTFGIGGRSFATVPGTDSVRGEALAITPDQKIVVAGRCVVTSTLTTHFCAIRLLPNGFFDTSFFGTGYKRLFAAPGATEIPRSVLVQPDGRIVIAGQCGPEVAPTHTCVMRLLEDGSNDDSFGTSGRVMIDFPGSGIQGGRVVRLLPDGKLLVGGQCKGTTVGATGGCVIRLNINGSLDTSFGSGGRVYVVNTLFPDTVSDLVVDPAGRIYVASWGNTALPPDQNNFAFVRRLLPGGTVDTSFGTTGTVSFQFLFQTYLPRLALQLDGRLAVASVCRGSTSDYVFCSSGLLPNGANDPDIGNFSDLFAGGFRLDPGEYGLHLAIQPDGRIVWAGTVPAPAPPNGSGTLDFLALRTVGSVFDLPFGADVSTTPANLKTVAMGAGVDRMNALAIQSDGKSVMAGTCDAGSTTQICVARLQSGPNIARNCTMDIDGDGRVTPTVDALILARASLGLSGSAVIQGITVSGPRNTWPLIREYLTSQCGMVGLAP